MEGKETVKTERTVVTFQSSIFNSSESRSYFINAENYGDDLAQWISDQLEKRGVEIFKGEEFPGQEDFGWFFCCEIDHEAFCVVVSHLYDGNSLEWVISVERNYGFIKSLIRGRHRDINRKLLIALHDVLSSSDDIHHIRWHRYEDFSRGTLSKSDSSPV